MTKETMEFCNQCKLEGNTDLCDRSNCYNRMSNKGDWEEQFNNHWRTNISPFCTALLPYEDTKRYIRQLLSDERARVNSEWMNQKANDHDARIRADERSRLLSEITTLKIKALTHPIITKDDKIYILDNYNTGFDKAMNDVLELINNKE